jgi:hypothetical protein
VSPEHLELRVPIYLNQKVVFDLLAMIEDGFSEFRDVTYSGSEVATARNDLEASVSASNVLQFIGLALKVGARRGTEKQGRNEEQVAQRKVHTPASLFYKLRSHLEEGESSPVRVVESLEDLRQLSAGEFVEFRAILRKNPLVELFEILVELAGFGLQVQAAESGQAQQQAEAQQAMEQLTALFGGLGNQGIGGGPALGALSPEQQVAEGDPTYRMIKIFQTALGKGGALEVIGELLDAPGASAVLSTKLEGFESGDASEIIDGEFRVLGKVVRVVASEEDGEINLLRKTPFGALKNEFFEQLTRELSEQNTAPKQKNPPKHKGSQSGRQQDKLPFEFPEVRTRVSGPAILVLPVAIFV